MILLIRDSYYHQPRFSVFCRELFAKPKIEENAPPMPLAPCWPCAGLFSGFLADSPLDSRIFILSSTVFGSRLAMSPSSMS